MKSYLYTGCESVHYREREERERERERERNRALVLLLVDLCAVYGCTLLIVTGLP